MNLISMGGHTKLEFLRDEDAHRIFQDNNLPLQMQQQLRFEHAHKNFLVVRDENNLIPRPPPPATAFNMTG